MARCERGGLSQVAFCTQEGIALHSFKKHHRRHKHAEAGLGRFVAVTPPASSRREWKVELTLPNGVRLTVRGVGRVE